MAVRLDRMIVDYLLRTDHQDEALKLIKASALEDLVDLDVFTVVHKVSIFVYFFTSIFFFFTLSNLILHHSFCV